MERLRRALVVGFDYYGRYLANLMNEHSDRWSLCFRSASRVPTALAIIDATRVDAIVCFGGPGPNFALSELARRRKIPVVVIWAGTDVLAVKSDPPLLELVKSYRFVNVSDGPWLVDELAELGISAEYIPVTAVEPARKIAAFPSRFSVLTYLPEPRRIFYGEKTIYEIAAAFPDVPFTVVGRGESNRAAPPNVIFVGHVNDMPARIDAATVLLRLPKHDGKSMLVLEALARARHVIWNYDFPGVHHAPQVDDAMRILGGLKDANACGTLAPNLGGYDYVTEHFGRSHLARRFESVLDQAANLMPEYPGTWRRVAISGLDLFAAQVTRELNRHPYGWVADPLRSRSRLEVVTSMLSLAACDVWYSIGSPIGDRWLHLFARLLGKPRVIHWVGSDITALRYDPRLSRLCRGPRIKSLAEATWTVEELSASGVDASLAPLPPDLPSTQTPPLPQRFTVLFYLPKTRGEFYGRREYERLIRAFARRNVRFFVVGGGDFYAPPGANVCRLGWRSTLSRVYADTTVLVRFTAHDGLSLMTLEALAYGRHVLWTRPFPFVTRVQTYDEIEASLRTLLNAHEAGELRPQDDAVRFVTENYSAQRCIDGLVAAWKEAAHVPDSSLAGATS